MGVPRQFGGINNRAEISWGIVKRMVDDFYNSPVEKNNFKDPEINTYFIKTSKGPTGGNKLL